MTEDSRTPRTGFAVAGSISVLIAAVLIAAGALALWGDSKKDTDGYLSTGTEHFTTATRALQSERLDIDIDSKTWIAGVEDLGDTRLKVAPSGGEPVFAGIARERDVKAYLRGVEHTVLEDIDSDPFRARQVDRSGDRAPAAPAEQGFWAASTQGSGPQTLNWTPGEGGWAVVVMNADGSPGVAADVSAGAEIAFLEALGWSLAGGGVLLLVGGAFLLRRGIRPRTRPVPAAASAAATT